MLFNQLFNMLNEPFDLRALARPACPPPRCPLCSTFAQQHLFVSIQGIGLILLLTLTLRPSPPWPPAPFRCHRQRRRRRPAGAGSAETG